MLGTTASKVAAFVAAVFVSAGILSQGFAAIPPPPSLETSIASTVLLVATVASGEIETHWLPQKDCDRVVAALRAGQVAAGVRFDGTRTVITRANCSLRNAQLAVDKDLP